MDKTVYRLFHFCKGDAKLHDPGWVLTGEFSCYAAAINALRRTKSLGYREFRLIKITEEELLVPEIKELQDANQNQPR